MKIIHVNEGINVQNVAACYLCGAEGYILYKDLRDRLFGAPGKWDLKKCCNPRCDLIWLDPMPTEADLHKIYERYYTHQVSNSRADNAHNARAPRMLLGPFLPVLKLVYQLLEYLSGMNRALPQARMDATNMYLANNRTGRLLDVGCGNGAFLDRMRSLGWHVQGVEVDRKAAKVAKETFGLPVFVGTLEEAKYPCCYFDAITLSHVIEHVYDPVVLLKRCYRILKPEGHLVALTPNISSIGHMRFKRYWRGLEPPRHLHLFSPSSLKSIASQAGFQKAAIWTTPVNAEGIALESFDIQHDGTYITGSLPSLSRIVKIRWFQLRAFTDHQKNPDSGEELVLKAWR
jgi:2-polyprenyl-3-methyl-5-hydroxy-6-metoxy-1,4-benzoquinol methylase